jgi:hypothetical protein
MTSSVFLSPLSGLTVAGVAVDAARLLASARAANHLAKVAMPLATSPLFFLAL